MRLLILSMDNTSYADRSHEVKVAEAIARWGNDVVLCTERAPIYHEGEQKPEGLVNYVMPINRGISGKDVEQIMQHEYDAIFLTSISGIQTAERLKEMLRVPVVTQVLDIPMWRLVWKHWYEQWRPWLMGLRCSDRVIANTCTTKYNIMRVMGDKNLDIDVVYYGMDSETADKAPLEPVEHQVSFTGRLVFYKGVDIAMYALSQLGEKAPTLLVMGEGEEHFKLMQLCQIVGVKANFLGGVSDLEKFKQTKKSLFSIYPDYNRFITGIYPLESLYCQRACIVHDMPINKERYAEHVEYANVFNTKQLAEKIKFLVDNPDYCKKRGEKGRKWVAKNRTFKVHAEGILKVLKSVVK